MNAGMTTDQPPSCWEGSLSPPDCGVQAPGYSAGHTFLLCAQELQAAQLAYSPLFCSVQLLTLCPPVPLCTCDPTPPPTFLMVVAPHSRARGLQQQQPQPPKGCLRACPATSMLMTYTSSRRPASSCHVRGGPTALTLGFMPRRTPISSPCGAIPRGCGGTGCTTGSLTTGHTSECVSV